MGCQIHIVALYPLLVQFAGEEHLNEFDTFLFCASNNIENTKKEKNSIIKKEIEVRKERRT